MEAKRVKMVEMEMEMVMVMVIMWTRRWKPKNVRRSLRPWMNRLMTSMIPAVVKKLMSPPSPS